MDAVNALNLSKEKEEGGFRLSEFSLRVPEGGVCGLLGPKNAGKSTVIRLLAGLEKPDEGMCSVFGVSPWENRREAHRLCGVYVDTARMYGYLTGMQNLLFFGAACGMEHPVAEKRATVLLKELDIWQARNICLREYTPGMARRLSLARALIHRPRLLLLDEPAYGLDPVSSQEIKELVQTICADDGIAAVLSTQDLEYAQTFCKSLCILENGCQKASGSFRDLCTRFEKRNRACIRLAEGSVVPQGFVRGEDGLFYRDLQQEDEMPKLLHLLVACGAQVYEARIVRPSLQDVYASCINADVFVERENGNEISSGNQQTSV